EDGIRDGHVTGVQTCALPIFFPKSGERMPAANRPEKQAGSLRPARMSDVAKARETPRPAVTLVSGVTARRLPRRDLRHNKLRPRSEERRVGKEGTARIWMWE